MIEELVLAGISKIRSEHETKAATGALDESVRSFAQYADNKVVVGHRPLIEALREAKSMEALTMRANKVLRLDKVAVPLVSCLSVDDRQGLVLIVNIPSY